MRPLACIGTFALTLTLNGALAFWVGWAPGPLNIALLAGLSPVLGTIAGSACATLEEWRRLRQID